MSAHIAFGFIWKVSIHSWSLEMTSDGEVLLHGYALKFVVAPIQNNQESRQSGLQFLSNHDPKRWDLHILLILVHSRVICQFSVFNRVATVQINHTGIREVLYIHPPNWGIHGDENNVCLWWTTTFRHFCLLTWWCEICHLLFFLVWQVRHFCLDTCNPLFNWFG